MPATNNAQLVFPEKEFKVQSPFLYLQTAGSTGLDGSTYGAHVRWLLLRNLGDTHLAKADYATTTINFNRPGDYVTLLRSQYVKRFPAIVDFSVAPNVVNDALAFWIYTVTNTNTVVYIYFRDPAKYAGVRATLDPATVPLKFIEQYCPGLIEAEVKDKLFFACEFDVERDAATAMRAEALSVETNVPLSPVFVSCRKVFTDRNWCPPVGSANEPRPPTFPGIPGTNVDFPSPVPPDLPACCGGPNLLRNGGFEAHPALPAFAFETDYVLRARNDPGAVPGEINLIDDAKRINPSWVGLPHSGNTFLAVDGSETPGSAVLRFKLEVAPQTDYCFAGWLATLYSGDLSVPLQFRFTSADGSVQVFNQITPAIVGKWEEFDVNWKSGASPTVTVEIIGASVQGFGNDFGIDDLCFCKAKPRECRARIMSENVRSVRFDVNGGYPRRLEFETYHDYIAGALWQTLDDLALTTEDSTAFSRLEPSPNSVNGHWQKFNDQALLNVSNYENRWTRVGGLSEGVQRYIALSNNDPMAIDTLAGDIQPQDGSIEISWLDALRMVSLDFHVARMLGMGYLDRDIQNNTDEFIYLGVYDTEGALDDTNIARPVRHYYMGVPTDPLDYRLPDAPLLKPVTYGLTIDNGEAEPSLLTDAQGYTPDGLSRYVNLFVELDTDINSLGPFFVPPVEFCSTDKTSSVFYGIEHRQQGDAAWSKPEIAHDAVYKDLDNPPQVETLPLPNNADASRPILRHEERENGVHEYGGYGINWFSRVSPVGNIVATDATLIQKGPAASASGKSCGPAHSKRVAAHAHHCCRTDRAGKPGRE